MAMRVALYAVFTVPVGSEVVVIVGDGGLLIVMLNLAVAVADLESVTVTEKLLDPAVVGVPVIAPLLPRVRPAGRELPLARLQVYGAVPPVAAKFAL